MIPRPCAVCGELSEENRCRTHKRHREALRARGDFRARGYDAAWDRLSQRARARQNFCTLCLVTNGLSADHLPIAWWRKEHNLPIRLRDVQVLCAQCQADVGSSRPGSPRYERWLETRINGGVRGDERRAEPASSASGQSEPGGHATVKEPPTAN